MLRFDGEEHGELHQGFFAIPGVEHASRVRLAELEATSPSQLSQLFVAKMRAAMAKTSRRNRKLGKELRDNYSDGSLYQRSPERLIEIITALIALPGSADSYVRAFELVGSAMWGRCRELPEVADSMECFCWIDIDFITASLNKISPAAFNIPGNNILTSGIFPFAPLIEMYEHEGYLSEALEAANLANVVDRDLLHQSYSKPAKIRVEALIGALREG